jgi:hypothetical protein
MQRGKWPSIITGIALFVLERGLDVSGVENMTIAIILWVIGGILLLFGIWLWIRQRILRQKQAKQLDKTQETQSVVKLSRGSKIVAHRSKFDLKGSGEVFDASDSGIELHESIVRKEEPKKEPDDNPK